jgi:hypothetical protein
MQAGGFAAAALLAAWALTPNVLTLYGIWAALGLCMASTLYEPAFLIVGRAHEDPGTRLRALAAVTLFGGLASTVFLPLTAFLVAAAGWRGGVIVLASLLAVSTYSTRALVFRHLPGVQPRSASAHADGRLPDPEGHRLRFAFIGAAFALASLASAAFTTNLLPALGERGISPARAAMLGALIGVMQLPGRALLMNGFLAGSPIGLLAVSLVLQASGLGGVALAASMPVTAAGTMVFALGAGLTTLVRPHLIQAMFGAGSGGYLNGRIARQQQLARAAGPIVIAWVAGIVGYATVFTAMAGTFAVIALASKGVLGGIHGRGEPQRAG